MARQEISRLRASAIAPTKSRLGEDGEGFLDRSALLH